jgi:hypothetical protein
VTLSPEEIEDIFAAAGIDFYSTGQVDGMVEDLNKGVAAIEAALRAKWFSEPVAIVGTMPGADAWTTAVFPAEHVPTGSEVFTAPETP